MSFERKHNTPTECKGWPAVVCSLKGAKFMTDLSTHKRFREIGVLQQALCDLLELYRKFCFTDCQPDKEFLKILEEYMLCSSKLIFCLGLKDQNNLSLKLYISSQYVKRVLQEFRNNDPSIWAQPHLEQINQKIDRHFKEILHDPFCLEELHKMEDQ